MSNIHIVSVASEMMPLAKTGGLADVCGVLPVALEKEGCRCTAFLPAYRSALTSGLPIQPTPIAFTIVMNGRHVACRILETTLPDSQVKVYLIDQPHFYDRDGLYGDRHGEYRDNCERFAFYNRAVVHAIEQLNLKPDIVHCHDWQTGLMPAYIKTRFGGYQWLGEAKSLLTIHNLAYQGRFWHLDMPLTGLDWQHFNWREMEYHGDLNFMKTGIVFADAVTTVSPTYAREITQPEHGCGLDGILRERGDQLVGIVNGVDYSQWDPTTDPFIAQNFGLQDWQVGKAACKADLQRELGLSVNPEVPLIGIVSRLASQKGWDLIIPYMRETLANHATQWAIVGTGDPRYEQDLRQISESFSDKVGVRLIFSEEVAHKIEAGCDMFLMPSRYEPCGLNQLYSLKYGTIPVVHATGGLVDTVQDANPENIEKGIATGFSFPHYSLADLRTALTRALDLFGSMKPQWGKLVTAAMQNDWSWGQSARRYIEIYQRTLKQKQSFKGEDCGLSN